MKRFGYIKRIHCCLYKTYSLFFGEVEGRMIKRESFFSILIGLFLLIISPLIVHAAPEEIQPVKAGEYHCVSYPVSGPGFLRCSGNRTARYIFLWKEETGTDWRKKTLLTEKGSAAHWQAFSVRKESTGFWTQVLLIFRIPWNYNSITKHRLKLYTMRKSQGMRYTSLRKKKIKPDLPNLLNWQGFTNISKRIRNLLSSTGRWRCTG